MPNITATEGNLLNVNVGPQSEAEIERALTQLPQLVRLLKGHCPGVFAQNCYKSVHEIVPICME